MVFDPPISQLFGKFVGHLVELDGEVKLNNVLMFHSNIEVGQHGHMLYFSLLFFLDFGPKLFPVPFNVVQTGLDSFDSLLMQ